MGKIKKKGTSGQAKNFITRTQAVRKLQVSLPDFRRLCIFKGIYPREPRNKKKASKSSTASTTFYYTKDIQYLLHEPLLNKFRDHKALSKKIGKALGRGEVGDAARLEKTQTPRLTLDHIIKERYPTFVDALRDLDDALSMLFLFANLPSTSTVPPKTIALCQRLCLEFEHYLIVSHSLRKSFLSIKGIYYQATIQGQDILWLVPYKFVQRVTGDVDFRIMGTFVELYTTLLGFVNFRLYSSVGLVYPPKFNAGSDERGGELGAFTLEGRAVGTSLPQIEAPPSATNGINGESKPAPKAIQDAQAQADSVAKLTEPDSETPVQQEEPEEEVSDKIDTFEATGPDADILPQPQISTAEAASLFSPFTFYLSRETPRQPLEFLLRSFGCKRIGWDAVLGDGAFTTNEADPAITHQIVDRPNLPQDALPPAPDADGADAVVSSGTMIKPATRVPGRTYVQPQWVWDCVNAAKLLRPDLYAPGATLPPHLSPWVKPSKGQYDPTAPLAEQEREGEAEEAEEAEAEAEALEHEADEDVDLKDAHAASSSEDEDEDDDEVEMGAEGMQIALTDSDDESDASGSDVPPAAAASPSDEEDAEESASEDETVLHQRELEAEAAGLPFSHSHASTSTSQHKKSTKSSKAAATGTSTTTPPPKKSDARKKAEKKRKQEQEELDRQKMMMSRKKRKVLDKMLYSNRKKDEEAERLRGKRRRIEKAAAAAK
ncbi:MAG: mRNA-binding ribosome synthesis protein nop7 [Sarea resinae]|nr:MAG: mRNA-binding ribosome synthesis protein nop7 [Sarea resinae]